MLKKSVYRAAQDTWGAISGGHTGSLVFTILVAVIGFAEPLLSKGFGEMLADAWSVLLNGLYGVGGATVLIFLYQLIAAPYRIQKERASTAESELRNLKPVIDRQALLDEISDLREKVVELRIELLRDPTAKIGNDVWHEKYTELQDAITKKIEKYESRAEANTFRTKGNMVRRPPTHPHQRWLDFCIHDIDYLTEFIKDYSRKKRNG